MYAAHARPQSSTFGRVGLRQSRLKIQSTATALAGSNAVSPCGINRSGNSPRAARVLYTAVRILTVFAPPGGGGGPAMARPCGFSILVGPMAVPPVTRRWLRGGRSELVVQRDRGLRQRNQQASSSRLRERKKKKKKTKNDIQCFRTPDAWALAADRLVQRIKSVPAAQISIR